MTVVKSRFWFFLGALWFATPSIVLAQSFAPPTPCEQHFVLGVGGTLSFPVIANAPAGRTVTLTVAGLPPSARTSPSLPVSGNPASALFSWTPTQSGSFAIVFVATVQGTGAQTLCSITANVLPNCAGAAQTYGTGCAPASSNIPKLTPFGCPSERETVIFEVSQAQPGATAVLIFSLASGSLPMAAPFPPGCLLLLGPPALPFVLTQTVPAFGVSGFSVPLPAGLPRSSLYLQAAVISGSISLTRAVEIQTP